MKQRRSNVFFSTTRGSRRNDESLKSPGRGGRRIFHGRLAWSSSVSTSYSLVLRLILFLCFPLLLISILTAVVLFTTSVPSTTRLFPISVDSIDNNTTNNNRSLFFSSLRHHHNQSINGEDIWLLRRLTYAPNATNHANVTIDDWTDGNWPMIIHIVKTRFMQEQGSLLELAKARLLLFRTFCLPTIQRQTTQHFLWIIKYDPNLDLFILSELVRLLQEISTTNDNVYLVPSNRNFRINQQYPGGWRDAAEIDDTTTVLLGNKTRLEYAMALQDQLPVLETRLDADDGLHVDFIRSMQAMALNILARPAKGVEGGVKWMYWCSRRHLEWYWALDNEHGRLEGISHERLCVTPGMTTGFAVGTAERSVPIFAHHELVRNLEHETSCGAERCLQFMDRFVFDAIRSRCPTSAGMANILAKSNGNVVGEQGTDIVQGMAWVQYAFWDMMHESFSVSRPSVAWVNEYVKKHIIDIAKDNLKGQCTSGHSCKNSAKQDLEVLIASLQHNFNNRTSQATVE